MWRAALTVRVATARANTARVGCRAMMGLPGPNVLEQARVPCERRQTAGVPLTAAWPTHGAKRWLINLQEDTVTDPVEGPAENERLMPLAEYFAVRKKVNLQGLGLGVLGGVTTFFGSSQLTAHLFHDIIGNPYADPPVPPQLIWDMDPMIVLSLGVMATTAVGFGITRVIYRKSWEFANKDMAAQIEKRERDIFKRVERHRAVGEEQQDDYYGESIKSAGTYLLWLRKQKARRDELKVFETE